MVNVQPLGACRQGSEQAILSRQFSNARMIEVGNGSHEAQLFGRGRRIYEGGTVGRLRTKRMHSASR